MLDTIDPPRPTDASVGELDGRAIYERVPLGTLLRYFDGTPPPPERHRRKLRDWQDRNGTGRLIEKMEPMTIGKTTYPATFTLHTGNYGLDGIVMLVVHRTYNLTTARRFEILELPRPGMVRVLSRYKGKVELRHLACDIVAAEVWLATNRYSDPIIEVVGKDEFSAG